MKPGPDAAWRYVFEIVCRTPAPYSCSARRTYALASSPRRDGLLRLSTYACTMGGLLGSSGKMQGIARTRDGVVSAKESMKPKHTFRRSALFVWLQGRRPRS